MEVKASFLSFPPYTSVGLRSKSGQQTIKNKVHLRQVDAGETILPNAPRSYTLSVSKAYIPFITPVMLLEIVKVVFTAPVRVFAFYPFFPHLLLHLGGARNG